MKTNLLALVFLVVVSAAHAQTTNLTSLLQQGLLEEQANGNLDAAIADYRSLALEFDKDRQLAATAVFRLGECYRAQGKTNEATAQYQRVLRDFSDQATLSTLSRQNLTGLGVPVSTTSGAPMLSDAARQKQKNLFEQEIKLVEQRIESQQALVNTGVLKPDGLLQTQEKLFELKRQLVGLDAGQPESIQAPAPTDAEEQEIQRIRQMVQNSPDLINRSGGETRLTPLCAAASKGQLRVAEFLLEAGADINLKSDRGFTPLYSAAGAAQNAMVEFLLDHNAAVDARGDTSLYEVAGRGYKVVAETLLAHHANVNMRDSNGRTPLYAAAESGNVAIIELLIAHGADINVKDNQGRTPLSRAANIAQNDSVVKALLDAKADPNAGELDLPLLCAIHREDAASAEMLLHAGANPNVKGKVDWEVRLQNVISQNGASVTPLFEALTTSQPRLVQLLLKFKADPNDSQTDGRPVLFMALSDTNTLATLLDAGAKVDLLETIKLFNDQPDKRTPLDAAVANYKAGAVEVLLKHGANPNAQDDLGETALHWAALFHLADEKVFRLLLEHKANPNVRDNNGNTPLDLVKDNLRHNMGAYSQNVVDNVVDLLHQHGALDVLPDWYRIEVNRLSGRDPRTAFRQGTNGWNRFTLLEVILDYYLTGFAYSYSFPNSNLPGTVSTYKIPLTGLSTHVPQYRGNTMPFPDLTRVVIIRPSHNSTNEAKITINLLDSTNNIDCSKDVPLEFGDMVEIPQRDHSLGESPSWLSENQVSSINNYLHGTVHLVVHDQKADLPLDPYADLSFIGPVLRQTAAQHLILSSSDLSRVKVTRRDPKTGKEREWILDCTNNSQAPDLRLRDGDVIEVPEKQ